MAVTRIEEGGLGTDSFNLPITLNGTDGSSTDAGDNIVLDASASGVDAGERLLYEGHPPNIPADISSNISVLSGVTLTIADGATIANSGTATGFSSADPSSADGDSLGTASLEWSDLYLSDGGVIYFGNDQDITITHNPDAGVTLGGTTPTLTIGDAGAEDTKIVFDGNAQDFHIGLDDSADDLVIGLGSALGTTTHMAFDETGAVTMPLQPAVLAVSATVSNVSGNGDAYTTANFETEIFDQNADFNNSNFTFTAPVTGRYSASITTHIGGCASDNTRASARIVASNRDIIIYDVHGYNVSQPDPKFVLSGHTLIDMDANDTLSVTFYAYNGSKVVDWLVNSSLSVNLVA